VKKNELIQLINFFIDGKDIEALNLLEKIGKHFNQNGDIKIAEEIKKIVMNNRVMQYSSEISNSENIILSDDLKDNTQILINSINNGDRLINKIMFHGNPGTGKTLLAKKISKLLNRELINITYGGIVDSKLGETIKNLENIFKKYNGSNVILFFDELDGISINRLSNNDIGEMSRITTSLLTLLDSLDIRTLFIGATNLLSILDSALIRRMDMLFDFDSYTKNNLLDINKYYANFYQLDYAEKILSEIISDKNISIKPFEIKALYKEMLIRKNASYSIGKPINKFINNKMNFKTEKELDDYMINNKNYTLINLQTIFNNKYSKSTISTMRNKNE